MKIKIGLEINFGIEGSNGYDEQASAYHYVELVHDAVRAEFPDCDLEVDLSHANEDQIGILHARGSADGLSDEEWEARDRADEAALERLQEIVSVVWQDWNWVVKE